MIDFHIIIPARYASSRLPAKVLVDLGGKPMMQHVYERALQSGAASVTIAVDHPAVYKAAQAFGATVCLTKDTHQSGTERIAEAVERLGLNANTIVVNVQSDQPLVSPSAITLVAESLAKQRQVSMTTVCAPLQHHEDLFNPNIVKVVRDKNGCALYFSRATIPWARNDFLQINSNPANLQHYYQHMGLYAYRANFIKQYLAWEVSPLEKIEMLEQLRVLWHGEKIYLAIINETVAPEVNSLEDLIKVKSYLTKPLP